ncbi:MAG: TolC family outer membrane protein [Gammaproteobacteria bacterium]|nr:TolC family outer membrane protein [Gammaproteobacteria bacterium]
MSRSKNLTAFLTAGLLGVQAAPAEDLGDAYERAVQSDPLLREAEANRLAALEAKPQARALLLPQANFIASRAEQDQEGDQLQLDFETDEQNPTLVPLNLESDISQTGLTLEIQQTIFRWDQWVALRQADSAAAQAEANYRAAQLDLMTRVAQRYFNVLAARDTLESEEVAKESIARQLEQAEKRFEVGLIAVTDVEEAQAAYDQAVAAQIAASRSLATARELLREITGEYFADLAAPGEDMPLEPPVPASEEEWVAIAMDQNLTLISSRLGADIAREQIKLQRAQHFPTLDLVASRNEFTSDGDRFFNNQLIPEDQDFSTDTISLQLNFPIFSGGLTSSRVRESVYRHRAAKEQLERVARETERLARDSYLGVLTGISRVQALDQAVESSSTALEATEAGFEVGTRTTVDVLLARRNLLAAQTNYARSRYDYLLNLLQLKQAAGTLTADDISQVNSWLEEGEEPQIGQAVEVPDPGGSES